MVSSTIGIATLDIDGRWREVNPALERMLGRPAAGLVNHHAREAMPRTEANAMDEAVARLVSGELPALEIDTRLLRGDGSEFPARLDIAVMRDGHAPLYLLAHVHDIGTRCASCIELQARNTALEHELARAAEALDAMSRLQEALAHGVSHDLRAPLRAIGGFSTLLSSHLEGGHDQTTHDYLDRIRAAAARMSALIDALLELSSATRAKLQLVDVDLGLLVDWAYAELADAEPGRSSEIVVQPDLHVLGDERQLRQLLRQLLNNAWKYSGERDRVRIEVSGERHGDRVVLAIHDHGSGFDMRYAEKLFEPFQRLHGPEQVGGNGIGLAIAHCIVERHGGRLWAQSEPGTGSTFFVELPAVPDAENN